jgi:hypothetical protein
MLTYLYVCCAFSIGLRLDAYINLIKIRHVIPLQRGP